MSTTPQDVQAHLDAATAALAKTTSTYPAMVKRYGSDWRKWPTGTQWFQALTAIATARAEVGELVSPSVGSYFGDAVFGEAAFGDGR